MQSPKFKQKREDRESRIVVEPTIKRTASENEHPEEFSFDLDNFDQSIIAQIRHQQNTSLFIKIMSSTLPVRLSPTKYRAYSERR
ncbi:hypothetical protein [Coxiella-like endosymbiont]|uniref:hypothetical protein n=1 Tax=Coxiella-like endosymbiont TaxID=1592897 RepID=UPI00272D2D61|nr:hypothetical protein [Coxiella-like endosymbiont]